MGGRGHASPAGRGYTTYDDTTSAGFFAEHPHAALYTPEETDQIRRYMSEYSINKRLRDEQSLYSNERNQMLALDSAIAKSHLQRNVLLLRNVRSGAWLNSLEKGSEFTDRAYVSTTISSEQADRPGFGGVRMEIRAKKGQNAAAVAPLHSDYAVQREVLLPRGSRFRVLSVQRNGPRPKVVLELL